VTTPSLESEPHVKHTITANGIRQAHTGGLVLSQLHIGLAVGFTIVACLTAFGGGVIVGMWYKASEQIVPLGVAATSPAPERAAPSQDAASQPQEPAAPVTFYNTLTNSNVAYAPLTPPAPASSGATAGTRAVAVVNPPRATPAGGTTRTAAGPESPQQTKAAPAPKAAPAAATVPPGSARVGTDKSAAPARQPERDTGAQRPAQGPTVATAQATSAEDFSVQVGSFGSAEQAERLRTTLAQKGYPVRVQPTAVLGQGVRYRVRVGNFADRTAADQTARHLTAQEQVPAIVAGKD